MQACLHDFLSLRNVHNRLWTFPAPTILVEEGMSGITSKTCRSYSSSSAVVAMSGCLSSSMASGDCLLMVSSRPPNFFRIEASLIDFTELPSGRQSSAELFLRGDPDSCSFSWSLLFEDTPDSPSELLTAAPPVRTSLELLLSTPPGSPFSELLLPDPPARSPWQGWLSAPPGKL